MGLSTAGKNAMLDSSNDWPPAYISLHSGDPSTTGANEISGGSPAYARLAPTWGSASSGSKAMTATLSFDIPASTTVSYFGFWTAATSGTFLGGAALSNSESFTGQGTYSLTADSVTLS